MLRGFGFDLMRNLEEFIWVVTDLYFGRNTSAAEGWMDEAGRTESESN